MTVQPPADLLREARDYVAIFADPPRLFQFSNTIRAQYVDEARALLARIDASSLPAGQEDGS